MRLRLFSILFLLGVCPSYAQVDLGLYEDCELFGEAVEALMMSRQKGASVSQLLRVVEGAEPNDLWETLALSAFDVPQYSSEEMRRQAAKDYRDPMERSCYNGRRKLLAEADGGPLEPPSSKPAAATPAKHIPEGALNSGWFVVVASIPVGAADTARAASHDEIVNKVGQCAMVPFYELSSKFEGLRPGFEVYVLGAYPDQSTAEWVKDGVRQCVPDAYIKRATYLGE